MNRMVMMAILKLCAEAFLITAVAGIAVGVIGF